MLKKENYRKLRREEKEILIKRKTLQGCENKRLNTENCIIIEVKTSLKKLKRHI